MRVTQRETVLRLLKSAGKTGVSAHDLVYRHGITRAAAVVYDLRNDGYDIRTLEEEGLADGRRRLARYELMPKVAVATQMKAFD